MAKDFKAGQIKTSKIIGKSGEKTVFYTDAESSDDSGNHAVPTGGTDVSFVFSGEEGDKDGVTGGVTLFTGDIVVSGTLYAEKQVVEVDTTSPGGIVIEGATSVINGKNVALHINGGDEGTIMWDADQASIWTDNTTNILNLYAASGIELNPAAGEVVVNNGQEDINFRVEGDNTNYLFWVDAGADSVFMQGPIGDDTNVFKVLGNDNAGTGNNADIITASPVSVVINDDAQNIDFRVESDDNQGSIISDSAENSVLFNVDATTLANVSKYNGGSPAGVGTDVNFHVGWDGSAPRNTAVIEGNLVISGTLSGGSPLKIGTDTRLDAVAGSTQYFNFGATDGSAGYGLRSNAGAIEFKNNAGAWAGIGSGGGGGSSAGAAGVPQVSDGSGGFDAADTILYDATTSKTSIGTDLFAGVGSGRLNVRSDYGDHTPGPTLVAVQHSGGGKDDFPVLQIAGDPKVVHPISGIPVALAEFNSKTDYSIIEITNNWPSATKFSKIALTVDDFSIKNYVQHGYVSLEATRAVDPTYYTSGDVDVIKCIKGTVNDPTVTILTNPTAPPAAILNSEDINFYVHGVPGYLGVVSPAATSKSSAKFGGDVQVDGCVARGSIMQLYIDTAQSYTRSVVGSYATGVQVGYTDSVAWTSNVIPLDSFYTWAPGVSGDPDITINKTGVYKISYSINFSQVKPSQNRTNMKSWLHDTSEADERTAILCSEAWSYGRGLAGGMTSKMTNTATTIAPLTAGDVINLNFAFTHGAVGTDPANLQHQLELNLRADQTWILIERVG